MPVLNRRNSGEFSNSGAVMGGAFASPGPVDTSPTFRRSAMARIPNFPGQLRIGQPMSYEVAHPIYEAVHVVHVAVIVTERLLIHVAEVMEGSTLTYVPWSERSEGSRSSQGSRVNFAFHVCRNVIHERVNKFGVHAPLRTEFMGVNRRSRLHVLADNRLHRPLRPVLNDRCANRSAPFQHPEHNGLSTLVPVLALDLALPALVHVLDATADERLINLNRRSSIAASTKFVEGIVLHRGADAIQHEPRRLLRHAKSAVKFPRRNTILAVQQHPDRWQPLLQRDRRVLKDRADLEGEARFGVRGVALPNPVFGEIANLLGITDRTFHFAVRPAQRNHEIVTMLIVRKVLNRIVKRRLASVSVVHSKNSMRLLFGYVKYIVTQNRSSPNNRRRAVGMIALRSRNDRLLQEALRRVESLSHEEQDTIAAQIIETLDKKEKWARSFREKPALLRSLAHEALDEHRHGETRPLDDLMG